MKEKKLVIVDIVKSSFVTIDKSQLKGKKNKFFFIIKYLIHMAKKRSSRKRCPNGSRRKGKICRKSKRNNKKRSVKRSNRRSVKRSNRRSGKRRSSTNKYERCVYKVKSQQSAECRKSGYKPNYRGRRCYNPWAVCSRLR